MAKLVCPFCGVFTSFSPLWLEGKGVLVEDPTDRWTSYKQVRLWAVTDEKYPQATYAILVCQACGERFVAEKDKYRDDWSAVYPIPRKSVAEEIPEPIKSESEEAHLCFAVKAYRGCLAMSVTALGSSWHEQGVSSLQQLKEKGIISLQRYKQADEVRLWANVIKHNQPMPEAVTKEDTEQGS